MNNVTDLLAALRQNSDFARQITLHKVLAGKAAEYGVSPRPMSKILLQAAAVDSLYSHQVQATDLIRAGQDVVVTTPTASGKTLIYNLPVLESYARDQEITALYLFPLKALAQDQKAGFERLAERLAALNPRLRKPEIALYDGDTSDHFRRKIRSNPPTVLVSNPEMLHLGILPYHEKWTTFLANLAYVVVDEAHTYRGVLGSHAANLLRRLDRLCLRYNARPVKILCTATVGNPGELGQNLLGLAQEPKTVSRSGAPQGRRHMLFMDPLESPATAAIRILRQALERDLRTIVYCRSRRMTELISIWATDKAGKYKDKISSYRAGFLPEERREIEAKMSSGDLLAVISTSALELGIDVGSLDLCILLGYPGSIMATTQRGGRVGRKGQDSAVILLAGEDALDQFFIHNPEEFFSRPPENAVLNPDNEVILARHLECAAAEMPLNHREAWLQGPGAQSALRGLQSKGLLLQDAAGQNWLAARKRPQRDVDLRGSGSTFQIQDPQGQIIGSVDSRQAFTETHPGAVYLHRGRSYLISDLDLGRKIAKAAPQDVKWHTRARTQKSTELLEVYDSTQVFACPARFGKLRVTEEITGYERRLNGSQRLLDVQPLDLPPFVFETEGLWFVIPDQYRLACEDRLLHFMGSIHALEHVGIGLMPLLVMADRNDFGGISTPMHPQVGNAAVFIYDGLSGGAGLTRSAFRRMEDLFLAIQRALTTCPCETGCPSCTHSPKCGSGNRPIDKAGALTLISLLISGELGSCAAPAKVPPARPSAGAPECAGPIMVLDVETRRSAEEVGGWNRADLMGVSLAVLWTGQEFRTFSQDELPQMFSLLRSAGLVVGFNSLRFDYKVLQPYADFDLYQLPSLDMLDVIRQRLSYRVSLDNLGRATFDLPKSADGLQALRWWKEGKIYEIAAYCRQDVDLTRRLFEFGKENGYLLFSNKAGQKVRVPVNW